MNLLEYADEDYYKIIMNIILINRVRLFFLMQSSIRCAIQVNEPLLAAIDQVLSANAFIHEEAATNALQK